MRAVTLDAFDTAPALRDDLPAPRAADGELVVRVHASSVNPVDAGIAAGMLRGMAEYEFPVTLGRDFAGVVEGVGPGVDRFGPGDEVFGWVPHASPNVHDGSWAESTTVREDGFVALKPSGVGFAEAGATPLAAVTALAALDALELAEGETILVVGATGGVGSFAVQLASAAGAVVIAAARLEDHEYLRGLGVSELVDRDGDVVTAVRELHPEGVDALLDVVSYSPDAFDAHAAALRHGGRGATPLSAAGDRPGRFNVMASEDPERLGRVARLLEDGTLRVPIERTSPLEEAPEALRVLGAEHTRGKLGISVV